MSKAVTTRAANENDIPQIIDLIRALADYEKLAHEVTVSAELLRQNLFGPNPVAHVLLAEADQEIIGFAVYFFNFSTFLGKPGLYLEDLFVRPEFRGLGAGELLFNQLAQITRQKQFGRMEWSVLDWNQPAIDFYVKRGARAMNDWTVYRLDEQALKNLERGEL